MGNEVAIYDALQSAVESAYQDLDLDTQKGALYMRVNQPVGGNAGTITYGQDNEVVRPDDEFVVNASALGHGWLTRRGSKVVAEDMAPYTQAKPREPSPAKGETYKQAFAIGMVGTGDHDGAKVVFSGDNNSVRTVFGNVIGFLRRRLSEDHGGAINPVVSLTTTTYESKTWGGTFCSVVTTLKGFVNDDGNAVAAAPRIESKSEAKRKAGRISV